MVTSEPISPDAGENEVMVKGVESLTVKESVLSTEPSGFVNVIFTSP